MLKAMHSVKLFALAAIAWPALAGMPVLTIGNPDASAPARSMHAVLTVKPGGCLAFDSTTVTAAAVGLVNGERRSISLSLVRIPEAGMYALTPQWPAEGRWVIQLTATDGIRTAAAVVPAGPKGVERAGAKFFTREVLPADINAILYGQPAAVAKK